MKSSANMIGAIVLGGMAKILENSAKDADINTIEKLHTIFLGEWLGYKENLSAFVVNMDSEQAFVKIDEIEKLCSEDRTK